MPTQLSKSDYMLYLRHPAWLWLKKHDKSKIPPIDDNTQALFDSGFKFETYAEKLFPNGVKIGFGDYQSYLTLPHRTDKALEDGNKTLFQARFEHDQVTCITDVVTLVSDGVMDLYEIKSSTEVKPEHKLDLAFQVAVLTGAGFEVRKISVIHVNNQYTRKGDIDSSELTLVVDVTEDVKSLKEQTALDIKQALAVTASRTLPDISPSHVGLGAMKDWLAIYKNLVTITPDSIYELASATADRIGELESKHITTLTGIPDDFPLTPVQVRQVKATKIDRVIIDPVPIKKFLGSFQYPLYFLDYETMANVIPYFNGMRPYQQVPFQYSLHILDAPNAKLRHTQHLHKDNSNPARPLSEALSRDIGSSGTVLAWYDAFEKSCNATLGSLVPEFEDFFARLNSRMNDLMIPFSEGWYVDKNFRGSASIKKVLPVLIPELSYDKLGIHEGGAAQRLWMRAVLDDSHPKEKDQILADLDEYCAMDTLAMVKIFEFLSKLS